MGLSFNLRYITSIWFFQSEQFFLNNLILHIQLSPLRHWIQISDRDDVYKDTNPKLDRPRIQHQYHHMFSSKHKLWVITIVALSKTPLHTDISSRTGAVMNSWHGFKQVPPTLIMGQKGTYYAKFTFTVFKSSIQVRNAFLLKLQKLLIPEQWVIWVIWDSAVWVILTAQTAV